MKQIVLAGFLLLAQLVPVSAQTRSTTKPPTGTTRVAVINLGLVFNQYERATAFKEETAHTVKKLQEEAKTHAQNITAWQAAIAKNDFSTLSKEQYEEKIITARRRLEDIQRTAGTRLSKSNETKLAILWNDVHDAVKTYSARHKIDLVIAYGDPVQKDAALSFPNIGRKMQSADQGGAVPFFIGGGADISEAVVELLNRQYREKTNQDTMDD